MTLPSYAVDFRGFPACPCQATWLPAFEHEAQRRGIIPGALHFFQLIGDNPRSGSTHLGGGATDWFHVDGLVELARQMGADPTWHRPFNWDGNDGIEHDHSVLRGCPHLSLTAREQITAVDADGDGLAGTTTPDPGPRPLSGRTWQEGITWAQQQEDDMADPATQKLLDDILAEAKAAHAGVTALRGAEADRARATRQRDAAIAAALDALGSAVASRAAKSQVQKIKQLLTAEEATP